MSNDPNEGDVCGCEVCTSIVPVQQMTEAQREQELARAFGPRSRMAMANGDYVVELEAENAGLRHDLDDAEKECERLVAELRALPNHCPRCHLDLTQDGA